MYTSLNGGAAAAGQIYTQEERTTRQMPFFHKRANDCAPSAILQYNIIDGTIDERGNKNDTTNLNQAFAFADGKKATESDRHIIRKKDLQNDNSHKKTSFA